MSAATDVSTPLVVLVGQPNAGKTSLFNAMTGARYHTANYPGVTVSHAEGKLDLGNGARARLVDVPGLASLSGRSPDEEITVSALFGDRTGEIPDLVVAVVDATQMARHLYLAFQLRDAGFRVVLAVTMTDLLARRGLAFSAETLARGFGAPVVRVNGRTGEGTESLSRAVREALAAPAGTPRRPAPLSFERVAAIYRQAETLEREALAGPDGRAAAPLLLRRADPLTERCDRVFLHPAWGPVLFLAVMSGLFSAIFWLAAPAMEALDSLFAAAGGMLAAALPDSWFSRLLVDGLVGGVGAVAVFLPQILILFLCMGFLEDSGYLARGALLVDRPLAAVGLSGRAFVPLLSGFACAIPAMMATRTIPSRRERLLTLFAVPLMTCSARLPVYGLVLAFLTPPDRPWLGGIALALLYLGSLVLGLAAAGVAGRFLKLPEKRSLFLELPAYRRPRLSVVGHDALHKTASYIRRAGLPILWIALALWTLTHFPASPAGTPEADQIAHSWGGTLGRVLEPLMEPMGLDWRAGVAMISGFAAREVFPGALAIMFHIGEGDEAGMDAQLSMMRTAAFPDGTPLFTLASSLGLLVFFALALQCQATVAVAAKESGSRRFALAQLVLFTGAAYAAAVAVVQGLRALGIR